MTGPPHPDEHERLAQLLPRYEFDALDADERVRFERHLLECDDCFAEGERGAWLVAELRDRPLRYAAGLPRPPNAPPGPREPRIDRVGEWWSRLLARKANPRSLAPLAVGLAVLALLVVSELDSRDLEDLASFSRQELAASIVRGPVVRSDVNELLIAGAGYFDLARYEDAAQRFRAALEREPDLPQAAYLLGLSLALDDSAADAVAPLQRATLLARGDLRTKAQWALANAYLRVGQTDECLPLLRALVEEDHPDAARARVLLARLVRAGAEGRDGR